MTAKLAVLKLASPFKGRSDSPCAPFVELGLCSAIRARVAG